MAANTVTNVAIVVAESTATADGIRDYSERLVVNLKNRPGIQAQLFQREHGAFTTTLRPTAAPRFEDCAAADAVVVQYNPFWYGRRGFAPGLALGIRRLRRTAPSTTVVLMVHETYVHPKNWKWALMGAWQRTQLRALQKSVHIQLCSIEAWTDALRRAAPEVPARHLPVPSNLPDQRAARAESRAELGIVDEAIVLATFGMHHAGRLSSLMARAASAVSAGGRQTVLLNLGTGEPARTVTKSGVTVIAPGYLVEDEAARMLGTADVFMAAFADGVSTRRGTVMAALQHEVAVVGTRGHLTDSVLVEATGALRLAPVDQPDAFVDAVVELAADDVARANLARRGRALYEKRFDWPVLVDTLLEAVEEHRS